MLLLWGVVLGVAVGFLRGGTIADLEQLELEYLWLIPISLLVQLLIFPLFYEQPIITFGTEVFHVLSYGILAIFVVLNWRIWPLLVMGAGMGLNFLVISLNGGYMPSSASSLIEAGDQQLAYRLINQGTYGNLRLMDTSTVLNVFGDRLYLPEWIPFSTAFSVGDLFIIIGLICFFGVGMVGKSS